MCYKYRCYKYLPEILKKKEGLIHIKRLTLLKKTKKKLVNDIINSKS